eukprot:symbB.v1.2.028228.t1/scaffold2962.1/size66436/3
MVPKLPLPGALQKATGTRPQTCQPEKDTAKLLEEVQAMQAALKQEEDQVLQLRQALSEKDTNASSSDNKDVEKTPTKAKKKGGILPSWMRNIIDKANQLMRPAATEFFPDKPYSQQRFTVTETMDSPGAGGQVRRSSFVRRNSFRQSTVSTSSRLTKSRTIGNLEPLDHSVSQASLSSGQPEGKERRHSSARRNSSVPAHMARMHGSESIAVEDLRSMAPREMSPKDPTRRSRRTRRNSEALSWTVFCISGHPEVEKRIVEELSALEDEADRSLTYQKVSQLPYLQAVVNEALRLYPSVAIHDDTLPDGTFVPSGTVVQYTPYAMARDETLWGYDRLVFNAGPRECLGKRLAYLELKACLAHIFRDFTVELAIPREEVMPQSSLTIGMSSGLPCRIHRRR